MNWIGGGLIIIQYYSSGMSTPGESKAILTEANMDILTELGSEIDTET